MNLRKFAQGKPCMIRLPGCSGLNDETVLCHWRDSSTGMGAKSPDIIGAWGCSRCHDAVDGRRVIQGMSAETVRKEFLLAIVRTQLELVRVSAIKW